jgi:hypothetical protein
MLTFSEVPDGANGTAAAAAAWAQHGLAVELSGLARIERDALRLTVRGYPEWRRVDYGALRVRVLGPRPPLEHLVLSLDVLMTGPWAGSRHAIDPHGLCLSFGNARLPTALGPLGDEPDEPDETDETDVAPEAEDGGAGVGGYAAVGPDLHWSATTFTADDVAIAAGECRRRDGACELRSRVPSYEAVRNAPSPSRPPSTVGNDDEEEEEAEAAAGVRVLLTFAGTVGVPSWTQGFMQVMSITQALAIAGLALLLRLGHRLHLLVQDVYRSGKRSPTLLLLGLIHSYHCRSHVSAQ